MRYITCIISNIFLLATAGCSIVPPEQSESGGKHSTFIEQTEPTIAIKPLTREQQEAKESLGTKNSLGAIIKKIEILPITPAIVIVPPKIWTMAAGRTVGQELQAWGEKAGWKVIWSMTKDWSVPASTSFSGEFQSVASDVIKTLAANGALVRAQFYEGNKTMVVTGPGVVTQ